MSRYLDLEEPICDVHTLALLIDKQIDNALQEENEENTATRSAARSALYYLINCLLQESETLREKFYAEEAVEA